MGTSPIGNGKNAAKLPTTQSEIFNMLPNSPLPLKTNNSLKPTLKLAGGTQVLDEEANTSSQQGNIPLSTTGSSTTPNLSIPSLLPSIDISPSLTTQPETSGTSLSEISRNAGILKNLQPVNSFTGSNVGATVTVLGNHEGVSAVGLGFKVNDVKAGVIYSTTGDWRAELTYSPSPSTTSPIPPGNIVKSPPSNLTNSSGFSSGVSNVKNPFLLPELTNSKNSNEIIKSYKEIIAVASENIASSSVPVGGEAVINYLQNLNGMLSRIQGFVRSHQDIKEFDKLINDEFKSDSSRGLSPSLKKELVGIREKINLKIEGIEQRFADYKKLSDGSKNSVNNARLLTLASELSTLTGLPLGDDQPLKKDGSLLIQEYLENLKSLNEKITRFNNQPWLSQQPQKNNITS